METQKQSEGSGAEKALARTAEGEAITISTANVADIFSIVSEAQDKMHDYIVDAVEMGYRLRQRALRIAILKALCAC